jgi:DNA-binding NarL/FixJ family response regulator
MPRRPPVTVVIASFEDIVLRGLRALIDEDESLELVEGGVATERLRATLQAHRPRVALLNFGSLENAAAIRELHTTAPETRLVVLANRPTVAEARQILSFGATACLAKSSEARDIIHAIHLASRGMHVLPVSDGESGELPGPELLTPREAEILTHLQEGRSNAEIALALQLSVETVRTHVRSVLRKVGVSSRRSLRLAR